ncbi:MAG: triphosphoribosyl-dephospho-CoA synthase [Methanimicrococcus sp.]|nr:triphosphoribosyl-dephospho-CoA synthase [Methanimicrococcus sp.]
MSGKIEKTNKRYGRNNMNEQYEKPVDSGIDLGIDSGIDSEVDSAVDLKAENIAVSASLAMVLEAASFPKPGNVHRLKDFKDTSFEDFMASAVSVQSVFYKCAVISKNNETPAFGPLFAEAVEKSQIRQGGGNTHFGTFILLLPIAAAAGSLPTEIDSETLVRKAAEICENTTAEDAVHFYKTFGRQPIPVKKTDATESAYDLTDKRAHEKIRQEGTTLFRLMEMGAGRDMIAMEWAGGFEKSLLFAKKLQENKARFEKKPKKCFGSVINSAVVYTFLEFLADTPDTFIAAKLNKKAAAGVQKKASDILFKKNKKKRKNLKKMIPEIKKLDNLLQKRKMNPGSTADITAAGIFIALLNGMTVSEKAEF